MLSLHTRSLVAASLVLVAFLGLTGLTLDRAFRDSAEEAVRERLQAHLYGLLAIAEIGAEGGMQMPDALAEERFTRPGSGLYAEIIGEAGAAGWYSRSRLGQKLPAQSRLAPGEWRFERLRATNGKEFHGLSFGVTWEDESADNHNYTFRIIEALDAYQKQVSRFRRSLWGWLGGAALVLLLTQIGILRWSLAPLRRVEHDLRGIEAGQQVRLEETYPRELRGLTDNLNALLQTERRQLERYRDALGDLAHSLKTPLAVLRGAIQQDARDTLATVIQEQTERMAQIVDYQLQRAATSGRTTLMNAVAIAPLVSRILASLAKVHGEKHVNYTMDIDPEVRFPGDEADLMELFGNLLDNAFKWCRGKVSIVVRQETAGAEVPGTLFCGVEDDGPGVPPQATERILKRGQRADATVSGHGIGLAVVQEIVHAYHGTLEIDAGPLGGARVRIWLGILRAGMI